MKHGYWFLIATMMWAPHANAQTAKRVPIKSVEIEEPELPVTPTFLEAVKDLPMEQVGKAVQFLDPKRGELVPYIIPPKQESKPEEVPIFTTKEIVIQPDDFGSSDDTATAQAAEPTPPMMNADEDALFNIPETGVETVQNPETIGLPPTLDDPADELPAELPEPQLAEPYMQEEELSEPEPAPKAAPKHIRISIPKSLPAPIFKPKAPARPQKLAEKPKTVETASLPKKEPEILPWKNEDEDTPKIEATEPKKPASQPKRVKVKAKLEVKDAFFTSRMNGSQPIDRRSTIRAAEKKVSFYSSVKANAGDIIRHQWLYQGKVLFEKPFTLKHDDWQGWTTVALRPNFSGKLTARLVSDQQAVLKQETITVVP